MKKNFKKLWKWHWMSFPLKQIKTVTKMKNWIIGFVLVGMSITASAGDFVANVGYFNEIRVLGNYKVFLQKGDVQKVEVKNNAPEIIDEKISCEVKDSTLTVRIKGDTYKERAIEVYITYTSLNWLTAKNGCIAEVMTTMTQDKVNFNVESGGKIKAKIDCKQVEAEIDAGGSIHLEGIVDDAMYKVSAGGTIGVVSLDARKVVAQITAGGGIILRVKEDLSIKILSGGNVSYIGKPEAYEQSITLGGKISKLKDQ